MKKNHKKLIVLLLLTFTTLSLLCFSGCVKNTGVSKIKEELINQVCSTNFDEYYGESKFSGLTLKEILSAYVSDNPDVFAYRFTCNEEIPQFYLIKDSYDTENFDYICAHIQTLEYATNGSKVVSTGQNFYFSINKQTNEILPFGFYDSKKDDLQWVDEKEAMIQYFYLYIETMMELL